MRQKVLLVLHCHDVFKEGSLTQTVCLRVCVSDSVYALACVCGGYVFPSASGSHESPMSVSWYTGCYLDWLLGPKSGTEREEMAGSRAKPPPPPFQIRAGRDVNKLYHLGMQGLPPNNNRITQRDHCQMVGLVASRCSQGYTPIKVTVNPVELT